MPRADQPTYQNLDTLTQHYGPYQVIEKPTYGPPDYLPGSGPQDHATTPPEPSGGVVPGMATVLPGLAAAVPQMFGAEPPQVPDWLTGAAKWVGQQAAPAYDWLNEAGQQVNEFGKTLPAPQVTDVLAYNPLTAGAYAGAQQLGLVPKAQRTIGQDEISTAAQIAQQGLMAPAVQSLAMATGLGAAGQEAQRTGNLDPISQELHDAYLRGTQLEPMAGTLVTDIGKGVVNVGAQTLGLPRPFPDVADQPTHYERAVTAMQQGQTAEQAMQGQIDPASRLVQLGLYAAVDPFKAVGGFTEAFKAPRELAAAEQIIGPSGRTLEETAQLAKDQAAQMSWSPLANLTGPTVGSKRAEWVEAGHNVLSDLMRSGTEALQSAAVSPEAAAHVAQGPIMGQTLADVAAKVPAEQVQANLMARIIQGLADNRTAVMDELHGGYHPDSDAAQKLALLVQHWAQPGTGEVTLPGLTAPQPASPIMDMVARAIKTATDEAAKAKKPVNVADVATQHLARMLGGAAKELFPDLKPAANAGLPEKAAYGLWKPLTDVNRSITSFMSTYGYMGPNPAYAMRNFVNNAFTGLMDQGLKTLGSTMDHEAFQARYWPGGVTPAGFNRSFGLGASAGGGMKMPGLKLGQMGEGFWSQTIWETKFKDTFPRLMAQVEVPPNIARLVGDAGAATLRGGVASAPEAYGLTRPLLGGAVAKVPDASLVTKLTAQAPDLVPVVVKAYAADDPALIQSALRQTEQTAAGTAKAALALNAVKIAPAETAAVQAMDEAVKAGDVAQQAVDAFQSRLNANRARVTSAFTATHNTKTTFDTGAALGLMRDTGLQATELDNAAFEAADKFRAETWQQYRAMQAAGAPKAQRSALWAEYRRVQDERFTYLADAKVKLWDEARGTLGGKTPPAAEPVPNQPGPAPTAPSAAGPQPPPEPPASPTAPQPQPTAPAAGVVPEWTKNLTDADRARVFTLRENERVWQDALDQKRAGISSPVTFTPDQLQQKLIDTRQELSALEKKYSAPVPAPAQAAPLVFDELGPKYTAAKFDSMKARQQAWTARVGEPWPPTQATDPAKLRYWSDYLDARAANGGKTPQNFPKYAKWQARTPLTEAPITARPEPLTTMPEQMVATQPEVAGAPQTETPEMALRRQADSYVGEPGIPIEVRPVPARSGDKWVLRDKNYTTFGVQRSFEDTVQAANKENRRLYDDSISRLEHYIPDTEKRLAKAKGKERTNLTKSLQAMREELAKLRPNAPEVTPTVVPAAPQVKMTRAQAANEARQQAEAMIKANFEKAAAGEDVYIAPQFRIKVNGQEHLVPTGDIARQYGDMTETNKWRPKAIAAPSPAEVSAPTKELWQMTKDETLTPLIPQGDAVVTKAAQDHFAAVKQALSEGKPVPPEVRADYPTLPDQTGKPMPQTWAEAGYQPARVRPEDVQASVLPDEVKAASKKTLNPKKDSTQDEAIFVGELADGRAVWSNGIVMEAGPVPKELSNLRSVAVDSPAIKKMPEIWNEATSGPERGSLTAVGMIPYTKTDKIVIFSTPDGQISGMMDRQYGYFVRRFKNPEFVLRNRWGTGTVSAPMIEVRSGGQPVAIIVGARVEGDSAVAQKFPRLFPQGALEPQEMVKGPDNVYRAPEPLAPTVAPARPAETVAPNAAPALPPPPLASAAAPAVTEPWQMTRAEYNAWTANELEARGRNTLDRISRGELPASMRADAEQEVYTAQELKAGRTHPNVEDFRHRQLQEALAAGRPVPPAVLADYPDLAAKYGQQAGSAPTAAHDLAESSLQRGESLSAVEMSKHPDLVEKYPWTMTASEYQYTKKVEQPFVGELSLHQLGSMSKNQKAAYLKKRSAAWDASGAVKQEWADKVFAAYERGDITRETPGVTSDARMAITHGLEAKNKATLETAWTTTNRIGGADELKPGDRVYDLMRRDYGTVTKKLKVSVKVEFETPRAGVKSEAVVNAKQLAWQSYDDLKATIDRTESGPTPPLRGLTGSAQPMGGGGTGVVPTTVTTQVLIPAPELDARALTQRLKAQYPNEPRQAMYGRFVQARNLQPEIDAKAFNDIFDSVGPNMHYRTTTENFTPTHLDTNLGMKVQIETQPTGVHKMVWENGFMTGSYPPGEIPARFQPLTGTEPPVRGISGQAQPMGITSGGFAGGPSERPTYGPGPHLRQGPLGSIAPETRTGTNAPIRNYAPADETPLDTIAHAAQWKGQTTQQLLQQALAGLPTAQPGPGAAAVADQRALLTWLRTQYLPALNRNKALAAEMATQTRDFALHNYSERTNLDSLISLAFPYAYWMTRTAPKWAARLAENPTILANYLRYKDMMNTMNADRPAWYRQNIDLGPVLGLDTPLYLNFEATLMPLYGLINDFNDPAKSGPGTGGLGQLLQTLSAHGFSPFTPAVWAYALARYGAGTPESRAEAAHWLGYFSPATKGLKSLTALAGVNNGQGLTLEPWLQDWAHGQLGTGFDVWDQQIIPKALSAMEQRGAITHDQAVQAAYDKSGPLWDKAAGEVMTGPPDQTFGKGLLQGRAVPNLISLFLGQGVKPRSEYDLLLNQAQTAAHALGDKAKTAGTDEMIAAWQDFYHKYPFYSLYQMASKTTQPDSDFAYSKEILSRLPPGAQKYDLLHAAGIPDELYQKYITDKQAAASQNAANISAAEDAGTRAQYINPMTNWSDVDRKRWLAGMTALAVQVATPAPAVKAQYQAAQSANQQMYKDAEAQWPGVTTLETQYNALPQGSQARKDLVAANPTLKTYWDWKDTYRATTPAGQYYGAPPAATNLWGHETLGWSHVPPAIQAYQPLIQKYAQKSGLDEKLIAAVIAKESNGANVQNAGGFAAYGPMQVVSDEKIAGRPTAQQLMDPETNIKTGTQILKDYIKGANGDVEQALYQYSGGSTWKNYNDYLTHYWQPLLQRAKTMFPEIALTSDWTNEKYHDAEQLFGKDIEARSQKYIEVRDNQGKVAAKNYLAANPDLPAYWDWSKRWSAGQTAETTTGGYAPWGPKAPEPVNWRGHGGLTVGGGGRTKKSKTYPATPVANTYGWGKRASLLGPITWRFGNLRK